MYIPTPNSSRRQLLAEALELSRSLTSSNSINPAELILKKQERMREIRELLKEFAHSICENCLEINQIPLEVREAFVSAVLLVTRYSSIGGQKWQGNIPSVTLGQYHADSIPLGLNLPPILNRLSQMFGLSGDRISEINHRLQAVDAHIQQQKKIIQAVIKSADIDSSQDYSSLFHNLFGEIPIPSAAINCIYTDTQIYFCIDYEGDKLSNLTLWSNLGEIEKAKIQDFLRSLNQFQFEQFQRFPTFGNWCVKNINSDWCDRLVQITGFNPSQISQSLVRSINIIPTKKSEALLVHDIWGHHWQLMLTQFETDYAMLSTCDQPLRTSEYAYIDNEIITCGELFKRIGDKVEIDVQRSRIFFHAEVQQRLGLLFTHLIGEIVADVAEFKFIWDNPQSVDHLLSSSIFKTEPTKLDLSLGDIDFLFLQVLRPLLEFNLSVFSQSELEKELLAQWQDSSLEVGISLKQAIAHLYQIFLQEYNSTYLPTITGDIGIFAKVVSNLLYLQNAIDSLYTYSHKVPISGIKLPFQDLLIIFIANYSSSDSYAEFWEIDDVLANYFLPCWQILAELDTLKV